jgi:hypothetical protein
MSGGSTVGTAPSSSNRDKPDATAARGSTTIYFQGVLTRDIADYFVQALRDGVDRDVIIIPPNSLQARVIRGAA